MLDACNHLKLIGILQNRKMEVEVMNFAIKNASSDTIIQVLLSLQESVFPVKEFGPPNYKERAL